jgi:hypothetical protein
MHGWPLPSCLDAVLGQSGVHRRPHMRCYGQHTHVGVRKQLGDDRVVQLFRIVHHDKVALGQVECQELA